MEFAKVERIENGFLVRYVKARGYERAVLSDEEKVARAARATAEGLRRAGLKPQREAWEQEAEAEAGASPEKPKKVQFFGMQAVTVFCADMHAVMLAIQSAAAAHEFMVERRLEQAVQAAFSGIDGDVQLAIPVGGVE